MEGRRRHYFRNWAGTFGCQPEFYFEPSSLEEIKEILKMAIANEKHIKAVGNGHSPSDIACSDDYLISLKNFNRILNIDKDLHQVTVETGILLEDLNGILHENNLALSNIGSISDVSVGGAIATGTHGTGIGFGILATQVTSLELLTASGDVVRCGRDSGDPDLFKACLCNIGALGIVTVVTIQCEPSFNLREMQSPNTLDNAILTVEEKVEANEHYRFMWYAHTDNVVEYSSNRTNQTRKVVDESWFWNMFVGYYLLEFIYWIATFLPFLVPWINKGHFLIFSRKDQVRIDRSDKIFNFDCLFSQYVTEWSVDIDKMAAVLQELKNAIEDHGIKAHFPIEVRFVKGDNIFLSPATGRKSKCFIGILMFRPYGKFVPYSLYWSVFTRIMNKYGGRPHWAKTHHVTVEEFKTLYPDFERFCKIRHRLDPDGIFMNRYLHQVLGGSYDGRDPLSVKKYEVI